MKLHFGPYSCLFFLVVALCFTLSHAVEVGNIGVDIPGGDLDTRIANSSLSCALACDANRDCVAWVWSYPGASCPTNATKCWLKNNAFGWRESNPCREFGLRQGEAGVDRAGGDLPGMPLVLGNGGHTTASACAGACKSNAGCVAWSFDTCGQQNCWLKSSVTGSKADSCRSSAVQGNVGKDLPGADMAGSPHTLSSTATSTDCSDICASTPGCNSWSYVTPGPSCEKDNLCWLKDSISSNTGNPQSCRTSLSQPGLSPPVGPKCTNGNMCHYNKCHNSITLIETQNTFPSKQVCSLAPGDSCTVNVGNGWAGNYKNEWNGLSLAEFTIDGWESLDYYDISYIVGFDLGLQIQPPNGGKTLTCPVEACADAYHNPDDIQTHTTKTGGQHIVTWCP